MYEYALVYMFVICMHIFIPIYIYVYIHVCFYVCLGRERINEHCNVFTGELAEFVDDLLIQSAALTA